MNLSKPIEQKIDLREKNNSTTDGKIPNTPKNLELKRKSLGSRLGAEAESELKEIGTIWNHKRHSNVPNLDLAER